MAKVTILENDLYQWQRVIASPEFLSTFRVVEPKEPLNRKCLGPGCEHEFIPKASNSKYCSPSCRGLHYREGRRRKSPRSRAAKSQKQPAPSATESKRRASNRWSKVQRLVSRAASGRPNSDGLAATVGYSVDDLRRHLERQFKPGMTWANYAGNLPWRSPKKKWHIDHVIPKRSFEVADVTAAYALTNLRPLWERDNLKKGPVRVHLL